MFNNVKKLLIIGLSGHVLSGCTIPSGSATPSGCKGVKKQDKQYRIDPHAIGNEKTLDLRELRCRWFNDKSDSDYAGLVLSQKYALKIYPYAIMADEVYDRPSHIEGIPLPSQFIVKELDVGDAKENLATGFFGKAFVRNYQGSGNLKRELIVVFRGTSDENTGKDYMYGNLVFFNLFENQFQDALKLAERSIQKANELGGFSHIKFIGHSLGGGLAQYVQQHHENAEAIVFNSSWNRGSWYDTLGGEDVSKERNAVRVHEHGEVLNIVRMVVDSDYSNNELEDGGVRTRRLNFYDDDPLGEHGITGLAMNLVKVASTAGDEGAQEIIRELECRRSIDVLNHPYYNIKVPRNKHRKLIRENRQCS